LSAVSVIEAKDSESRKLRSRKRHDAWIKANELARSYFMNDTVKLEIELANAYFEDVGDKALVFFGVCWHMACNAYRAFGIPYYNRFSPAYRVKVKKELWRYLPLLLKYRYFLHITLTIDPKNFVSQADAKRALEKAWNSLLTRLRKRYPWIVVIAAREWQENGIGIHLHALIAGLAYIRKKWIMETWNRVSKSGWAIELRTVHGDAKSVLNYVLKYIIKSAINVNSNRIDNVSAVVNWALNGKAFSISLPKTARLGFSKSNSNRGSNPCSCRWFFLGYVPYHIFEYGLTNSVEWVIEYFGLDKPPPYN